MADLKLLRSFLSKTDYEGGIGEMVSYGLPEDTGDAELTQAARGVEEAMDKYQARVRELEETYGEQLYNYDDGEEDY